MSIRENIELFGLANTNQYIRVLTEEFGAREHPSQANAWLLDDWPLYVPRQADDYVSILSFNNMPLPYSLVEALVSHTELFPDEILLRWTQEQDLITETTLGQLRARLQQRT